MRLEPDQIQDFYEDCYAPTQDGEKWARWRELSAVTKCEHVVNLLREAHITSVQSLAEVGCGDGAVLEQLARRNVGITRVGLDISSSAVELAAGRPGITEAEVFDGERIPAADKAYDIVVATHVLEHVPAPEPLVAELTRVTRGAVVIEVPLEHNVSARRPAARGASEAAGHLHSFDRARVRRMVTKAGWQIRAELVDPLPVAVHTFAADTAAARAKGWTKWLIRAVLSAAPPVAERLITLHYALIATPS